MKTFRINNQNKGIVGRAIMDLPINESMVVIIKKYKKDRSSAQRRLQHVWYQYISDALDKQETKEGIEMYCKYTFGIPILSRDSSEFEIAWHHMSQMLTYEQTINAMAFLEVTRLFKVKQNAEYLTDMQKHYQLQGIHLPTSEDLYQEAMGRTK